MSKKKKKNKTSLKDMESSSAAVSKILHLVIESYGLMEVKTLKLIGIQEKVTATIEMTA